MMIKKIVSFLQFFVIVLSLVGCNATSEVEYTTENNTNIANIVSELKENYHLADVHKNTIILRGTKTSDDSYVDDGSVEFTIYIDSGDREHGCAAAQYLLKRISAMCSNTTLSTLASFVYLNYDGYYVCHKMSYVYSKEKPDDLVLSITEFNSESLQNAYNALKEEHKLKSHHTWEHEGIKYSDADFELKPSVAGNWVCDASLHFDEDYSNDELIEIGEYAHTFLGSTLMIHSLETDNMYSDISYDITIFGNKHYVTGENKDNSETLVWESSRLD